MANRTPTIHHHCPPRQANKTWDSHLSVHGTRDTMISVQRPLIIPFMRLCLRLSVTSCLSMGPVLTSRSNCPESLSCSSDIAFPRRLFISAGEGNKLKGVNGAISSTHGAPHRGMMLTAAKDSSEKVQVSRRIDQDQTTSPLTSPPLQLSSSLRLTTGDESDNWIRSRCGSTARSFKCVTFPASVIHLSRAATSLANQETSVWLQLAVYSILNYLEVYTGVDILAVVDATTEPKVHSRE
ncbi:hypothetical protein BDP55DRAFT_44125 [Colletotrichum godetiae]|uniref:Uncharacterized protein n=1 Tax=Colletotrichum godetiae TaxID=1209918 RepID=A0AAJ0ARP8_9PEZI|nr:uncharacterized protein BDP55DRAFT_44125 [Colletotrichum godetiae]KAK1688427.1 hypothetical protein BDP55DRAFT_44125 [Colletotrichum godetiae]